MKKKEDAALFYSRQVILKEVGKEGQARLNKGRVAIVGAGGLGHPVSSYLAAAGIGFVKIIDDDKIALSNLHRQTLFSYDDVGKLKSEVLTLRLKEQNPFIEVKAITERLTTDNAISLLRDIDVVVDCSDNFQTKFLLHDLCFALSRDLVQASLYQLEGQLQTFLYSKNEIKNNGCLRCLWPKVPEAFCVKNCQSAGIIGAVAGVLGTLQGLEVIKTILGLKTLRHLETMIFNLESMEILKTSWKKNHECPICAKNKTLDDVLTFYAQNEIEISLNQIKENDLLIDIREESENRDVLCERFSKILNYPMSKIEVASFSSLLAGKKSVLICQSGKRSYQLAQDLKNQGLDFVYSLRGGEDCLK